VGAVVKFAPGEGTPGGENRPPTSWFERFCLPFLFENQNAEGGWGHRAGGHSAVEPTCWTLLALAGAHRSADQETALRHGLGWLCGHQLADGSWPAYPGQPQGCWATSLACLSLHAVGWSPACAGRPEALARGLRWLGQAWPGEGGFWWRLREKLLPGQIRVRQNSALRGWSWTPGTSSWVEPTSYALIALRKIPEELHPRGVARRCRLAEAMLYDRMCPEGGWNCGNPRVYGVAGEPAVGPTAWALLALQDYPHRPENQRSLDWLERGYADILGPGSLALANLCLQTYGRSVPPLLPALERLHCRNQLLRNVSVVAWAAIALSPARATLQWTLAAGD